MLEWTTIGYGGALSAVLTGLVVALLARESRLTAALTTGAGALAGPVAWNAILRTTNANQFFVDAPIPVFPVSWQDTGSAVFALAAASLLLGFGPQRNQPARRTTTLALIAGVVALLIDVYLY